MQLGEREQLIAFRAPNTNVDILNDFMIAKNKGTTETKQCICAGILTLSDFHFRNQNVLQGAIFFFWNQYSAIARKKSNTTAIIVRVKI